MGKIWIRDPQHYSISLSVLPVVPPKVVPAPKAGFCAPKAPPAAVCPNMPPVAPPATPAAPKVGAALAAPKVGAVDPKALWPNIFFLYSPIKLESLWQFFLKEYKSAKILGLFCKKGGG
jgi:hypothetical protein